jgi:catalase (peroxidase I)
MGFKTGSFAEEDVWEPARMCTGVQEKKMLEDARHKSGCWKILSNDQMGLVQ